MAIVFGSAGAQNSGLTTLSLALPSSIAAGDLLIIFVANKYPTNGPSTPSGYTAIANNQFSGGAGSAGVDSGSAYITVFVRVADGSESGNVSITLTGSNTCVGIILRYTKASTATWSYAAAGGSDNTNGTSWSVTAGSDPGVTANDMLLVASGIHGNIMTMTSEAVSQTGVTFGTMAERQDNGTNNGDDVALCVSEHPVSSGTGSAAPVYTATNSSASASGASLFLRLRELAAQTISCSAGVVASAGWTATITKGAVTVQSSAAVVASAGRTATISNVTPGVTVNASAGAIASAGQTATIEKGAVTVQSSAGVIASAGRTATITPGAITVQSSVGTIASAGRTATINNVVTVQTTAGAISISGQHATITPGAITVQANTGTIAAAGQQADVQPGAVSITANAAIVDSNGHTAVVSSFAGSTIQAGVGAINMAGQTADVVPGAITVTVNAAIVDSNGHTATIMPGGVTIQTVAAIMDSNGLSASVQVSGGAGELVLDDDHVYVVAAQGVVYRMRTRRVAYAPTARGAVYEVSE